MFKFLSSVLFASFLFAGCSLINFPLMPNAGNQEENGDAHLSENSIDDSIDELSTPMSIDIVQAYLEQGRLHVKARLEAKTNIQTSGVVLQLTGLKDGEVTEEQIQRLSEITPVNDLSAGQAVSAQFELSTPALTEYQLRCSWGADAVALLSKAAPGGVAQADDKRGHLGTASDGEVRPAESDVHAQSTAEPLGQESTKELSHILENDAENSRDQGTALGAKQAVLSNMHIEETKSDCLGQFCQKLFSVSADLVNGGDLTIAEVTLGLGVYWAAEGTSPDLPRYGSPLSSTEKEIKLTRLNLRPGDSRPLKINVDRPIPSIPGGRFEPHLRLVTIQYLDRN